MMARGGTDGYVSRGGVKLAAALEAFGVEAGGMVCADLGSNVGGFVQCLLEHGAERVYSIDTGYGVLDYGLRKDARVVVMERTNAMHVSLPESVDLVTIDVGWTRQRYILPAALRLLRPHGRILTLVKPHYEAPPEWLHAGVLPTEKLATVVGAVAGSLPGFGLDLLGEIPSPIPGHAGNRESWFYLRRLAEGPDSVSGTPGANT
jgi:23S rRNA (cytidine1920-2'-O)/16S rRNA (cytidine1409-2'-O)-methyltransferase